MTVDNNDYVSAEIDVSDSSNFLIMYDLTEPGAAMTNEDRVRIIIQFREVGGTWRDYENGPFGALYEEESTVPCNRCVHGVCSGERMRVIARTDYANVNPAASYFRITSKVTVW